MDKLKIFLQSFIVDWKEVFNICKLLWQKNIYTGKFTFQIPIEKFHDWYKECCKYETFLSDYGNCLRHHIQNGYIMVDDFATISNVVILLAMGHVSKPWWTNNKSGVDICEILARSNDIPISHMSIFQLFALTHYTDCKMIRSQLINMLNKIGLHGAYASDYNCKDYLHVDCLTKIHRPYREMEILTIKKLMVVLQKLIE